MSARVANIPHESQKVFFSYDALDHAQAQFIARRMRKTGLEISVLKRVEDDPFSKAWLLRTEDRMRQAQIVLCLIGERSWLLNSICWELNLAEALKKQVIGVRLHPSHMHITPSAFYLKEYPILGLNDIETLTETLAKKQSRIAIS